MKRSGERLSGTGMSTAERMRACDASSRLRISLPPRWLALRWKRIDLDRLLSKFVSLHMRRCGRSGILNAQPRVMQPFHALGSACPNNIGPEQEHGPPATAQTGFCGLMTPRISALFTTRNGRVIRQEAEAFIAVFSARKDAISAVKATIPVRGADVLEV